MHIAFDPDSNLNVNTQLHQNQINNRTDKTAATETAASAFALSIGNNNMMVGNQMGTQESVDEFQEKMAASDVDMKQDYMSVMSLSMSDEDYQKMVSTGEVPEDMDATDAVTIIDEIKAQLLVAGTSVAGFTDNVDVETLQEITGSAAFAQSLINAFHERDVSVNEGNVKAATDAVALASTVMPISDDTIQYMLENNQDITIDSLYHADHANSLGGSRGYKSQNIDVEALMPQIEDVVKRSGIEDSETALEEAKWMLERNIPLTISNLYKLEDLKALQGEVNTEAIIESVAIAMSAGIPANHANLTYEESIYTQAQEYIDEITTIPEAAADEVVEKGLEFNFKNLKEMAAQLNQNSEESTNQELSLEQLHARRVLEEARITMTAQANRMLLRCNVNIDITPMEELVDSLKLAEERINNMLFDTNDSEVSSARAKLYSQTRLELNTIPSLPVSILGQKNQTGEFAFAGNKSFSLHQVYEFGTERSEAYAKAQQSYEAIMTAPRADMGDSIKKAFRNVDAILEDMNLDIEARNQRAVRILGYNQIEITEENIELVKQADNSLRQALDRLSPGRVLEMIREDVNPLNMTIEELNNYLDSKEQDPREQAANYARFLMQLERQDEITELERESYIGIYRMISSLDKSDDSAVGRLVELGQETSFANLLQAMRSMQHSPMDYKIDDEFGGVSGTRSTPAIDTQINAAFVENLLNMGEPVSFSNLEAMEALRSERGAWFKPLKEKENERGLAIESVVDDFLEKMTDSESAIEAYNQLLDNVNDSISQRIFESDSVIDIKAMQSSMKQISILRGMAKEETFDVPVTISGEETSIRLTLKRENGAGQLQISMETEKFGKVAAEFSFRGEGSGYIAYENNNSKDELSELNKRISEKLSFTPELIHTGSINSDKFGMLNNLGKKEQNVIKKEDQSADISNTELYRISKIFIETLKSI